MPKPSKLPRWADVSGALTEPSDAQKDVGWIVGDQVPAQWLNWLQKFTYDWCYYLKNLESAEALTWTSGQTFTGGITVNGVSSHTRALTLTNTGSGSTLTVTANAGAAITVNASSSAAGMVGTSSSGHAVIDIKASTTKPAMYATGETGAPGIVVVPSDDSPGLSAESSATAPGIICVASSTQHGFEAETTGASPAGYFRTTSTGAAIEVVPTSSGPGITGTASATGPAALFTGSSGHEGLTVNGGAGNPGARYNAHGSNAAGHGLVSVSSGAAYGIEGTSPSSLAAAYFVNTGSGPALFLGAGALSFGDTVAANVGITNNICARMAPKAWARITTNGAGSATFNDSGNIDTAGVSFASNKMRVAIKAGMANTNYCVTVTCGQFGYVPYVEIVDAAHFDVGVCDATTGGAVNPSTTVVNFNIHVDGAQ